MLPYRLSHVVLWEVVAGAVLAALIGYVAGRTLVWAEFEETMERTSLLTVSLVLSVTALGVTQLAGMNGVLAAFVAGVVFNATGSSDAKERQEDIQETISRFFNLPIFVLLGLALPWERRVELGWGGLLFAVAVLLLRRMPAILSLRLLLAPLRGTKDLLSLG